MKWLHLGLLLTLVHGAGCSSTDTRTAQMEGSDNAAMEQPTEPVMPEAGSTDTEFERQQQLGEQETGNTLDQPAGEIPETMNETEDNRFGQGLDQPTDEELGQGIEEPGDDTQFGQDLETPEPLDSENSETYPEYPAE